MRIRAEGGRETSISAFEMANESVTLVTSDSVEFAASLDQVQFMKTVMNIVEDLGTSMPIKVANVDSRILTEVLNYAKLELEHLDDPPIPQEKDQRLPNVPLWQREFFSKYSDIKTEGKISIIEIINALSYLEYVIPDKKNAALVNLAERLDECYSVEQVRERFGIINDFTPEEEAENRKELEWLEA